MRIIDADELMELYEAPKDMSEWDCFVVPIPVVRQNILDMPTVDAVEVVRCKDCIHSFMTIDGEHAKYCDMFDSDDGVYFDKNHFCSYEERKGE